MELIADFRELFSVHPVRLPLAEALDLCAAIVADPTTRTFAALAGWDMRLVPYLLMVQAGVLVGGDPLPEFKAGRARPVASRREILEAAADLRAVSALT